jgi:hypothetical protein
MRGGHDRLFFVGGHLPAKYTKKGKSVGPRITRIGANKRRIKLILSFIRVL